MARQVIYAYERTVRLRKWLTLFLFADVAVILSVSVPLHRLVEESLQP